MRSVFTRHLPLLYMSFFLFFTASNLFFTSYTPFLKSREMDDTGVFIIFTSTLHSSGGDLPDHWVERAPVSEKIAVAVSALWLRTVGILAAFATVLLTLHNSTLMIASIASIAMIGTAFAFFNTSSSVLLFRALPQGKQGELLGIYSALTGIRSIRRRNHVRLSFIQFRLCSHFRGSCASLRRLCSDTEVSSERTLTGELTVCVGSELLLEYRTWRKSKRAGIGVEVQSFFPFSQGFLLDVCDAFDLVLRMLTRILVRCLGELGKLGDRRGSCSIRFLDWPSQ